MQICDKVTYLQFARHDGVVTQRPRGCLQGNYNNAKETEKAH